jgi:DNA polymerase/3'-5' exonuclease PolX
MDEKRKWPHADALAVAEELVAVLAPFCSRIEIAGSLRRKKPMVGDVEILFVPKFEDRACDLIGTIEPFNVAELELGCMLGRGQISKRPNINGTFAWGAKNKLALHRSGIPVDFFTTSEASWHNYLVCRTGGAESNVAICNAAIKKGFKWEPYSAGFYRIGHTVPMHSEREVFEFVGLPFLPPESRS